MSRFRLGLVLGKFAPLHKGHELLIQRALGECAHVVLLSYSRPEMPRCGPRIRQRWLESLFPMATSIVLDEGMPPNDAPGEVHREFVARLMAGRGHAIDAVYTSEGYGDELARVLAQRLRRRVAHVCVDPARRLVPVSGTRLRESSSLRARFLSPVVGADLAFRICLLGGESTGKTTLARALAGVLGDPCVEEYGRELWEARGGGLRFEDLLAIGQEQVRREEEAAARAARFVVCDTSPLATLFYSLELFGRADPALERLSHRAYDVTVLCAEDFAFAQDGTRRDASFRGRGQEWYRRILAERGIAWITAGGSNRERVAQVAAALGDPLCDTARR